MIATRRSSESVNRLNTDIPQSRTVTEHITVHGHITSKGHLSKTDNGIQKTDMIPIPRSEKAREVMATLVEPGGNSPRILSMTMMVMVFRQMMVRLVTEMYTVRSTTNAGLIRSTSYREVAFESRLNIEFLVDCLSICLMHQYQDAVCVTFYLWIHIRCSMTQHTSISLIGRSTGCTLYPSGAIISRTALYYHQIKTTTYINLLLSMFTQSLTDKQCLKHNNVSQPLSLVYRYLI